MSRFVTVSDKKNNISGSDVGQQAASEATLPIWIPNKKKLLQNLKKWFVRLWAKMLFRTIREKSDSKGVRVEIWISRIINNARVNYKKLKMQNSRKFERKILVARSQSLQKDLEWTGKSFSNAKRKILQKRPRIKLRT